MRRQEAAALRSGRMWPMESPLHRYLADIHHAMNAGAFYSALALSVAIPDICGAIEYPNEKGGKRYREWFDQWCAMLKSYLTAEDCYAIRCSYLHQGVDEFGGSSAIAARLTHIEFTVGQVAGGGWSLSYVPSSQGPEAKGAMRIPVEDFCRDMTTSADAWCRSRADDPRIAAALSRLIEFRPAS
jgi:hypothetical protein